MGIEDHDRRFLVVLDAAMHRARELAGERWGCRAGRTDCCIGPFPVNLLDARRLLRGLDELRSREPERAARIEARARHAVATFGSDFSGDPTLGILDEDEEAQQRFFDGYGGLPCPVLDPASGRCELYEHRPWTCRTYGPPIRVGDEDLPPCPFCFAPTSPVELDAMRVEPDPEGLEDALVDALEREEGSTGETVVAFAVLGCPPRQRQQLQGPAVEELDGEA